MTPTVITLCFSGIMMIIGVTTFIINQVRTTKHDTSETDRKFNNIEKTLIEVRVSLDEVKNTVTETRQDVKTLTNNLTDLDKRLTRVEEQVTTIFLRIDELKATKVDKIINQ